MWMPPETLNPSSSEKAQKRFSTGFDERFDAPSNSCPPYPHQTGPCPTACSPPAAFCKWAPYPPPTGYWSAYLTPVFLPQPLQAEVRQQPGRGSRELDIPATAPPLTSIFSDLHSEDLISVISHSLRAENLYKLDTMKLHKHRDEYRVSAGGEVEVTPVIGCPEDYPHPYSVLIPLMRYFKILEFHSASLGHPGWIGYYFQCYLERLTRDIFYYEWPAVRLYHLHFFNARLEDMKRGRYNSWQERDTTLSEQYLYKHVRKSSKRK